MLLVSTSKRHLVLHPLPTGKFYKVECGLLVFVFCGFFFLFSPEQDQVEEKQRYLANVRVFCSLAKNNWHCVYLVRKIASQYGMEFAQKLVTEAQFNWVFPVEILQQVKRRCILGDGSALLVFSLCCFGVFLLLCGSWGTHHIESGCEDDLSLRSIEWNLLWQ